MLYYTGSTIAAHRPHSIDLESGQWRGDTENAKAEMLYYKAPPLQPQATFHRPRVRSVERWHRECKGRDAILRRLHHCSHRPPSIDPGLSQRRGDTENAKAEMLYCEGSTIAATGHLP